MKKMNLAMNIMLVGVLFAGHATFADADSMKAKRIAQIGEQVSSLQQEISSLEKAENSGVVFSQSAGKHLVILTGAAALSLIRIGRAMQAGSVSTGVIVESAGRSMMTAAALEGAVVGIDIATLHYAIAEKKQQLLLLQDQLDVLVEK